MSERTLHVVIIGAGLGGACLAHGLKKAGISVGVYERESARCDGFFGFRGMIGPGGRRALRDALPPDLFATFLATCAKSPQHLTVYSEGLDELFTTGLLAAGQHDLGPSAGVHSVSLMTLRQLLLTGIEDIVRFGKEFVRYERRPDGRITAFFADGTTTVGDILVGADGSRSRVRKQHLPLADVQDCGFVTAYGQVDLGEAATLLPKEKMLRGISVVRSRRGLSFIAQPMEFRWDRKGEVKSGIGSVDAAFIETWPGMQYDNTRDHLMWGLMSSSRQFRAEPEALGGTKVVDIVADMTRQWDPALHALVRLTDPATVAARRTAILYPVDPLKETKVTLLGDASHVKIPDPGENTNATLHAAGVLSRLLAEVEADQQPIVSALRGYEAQVLESNADASREYSKCMTRKALMNMPAVGRVLAAGTRTRLRMANRFPRLKKRAVSEFAWLQSDSR
jgi:2-polyprenyl-6-methoxyphenol hydroxylase-like FAD-dependent oxidoreductase